MNLFYSSTTLAFFISIAVSIAAPHAASAQSATSTNLEEDVAVMDAAASTLKTIRSWVNSEPEAAIHAFEQYQAIRQYVDQKYQQYSGPASHSASASRPFAHQLPHRMKAIQAGIEDWNAFVPKYRIDQAKQIQTELNRQRDR